MSHTHTASSDDSILSIASENGFFWETIWNHGQNAQLKTLRKNPSIISPGDEVFVPDLREKLEPRPTEATHKFKLKGVPAKLVLRLTILNKPRANEAYVLTIDGKSTRGTTDDQGVLSEFIPPDAAGGHISLKDGNEVYPIRVGRLNPVDLLSGVQQRLNNLGYRCGNEDGDMDEPTANALHRFQQKFGLNDTGEADDATKAKLKELHV